MLHFHSPSKTPTTKCEFTTYCDSTFYPILDVLIESILVFSKYNITVYCINSDYRNTNDRVRVKRVDIAQPSLFEITKVKLLSAIESDAEISLTIDADMLATPLVDNIFNENRILSSTFPLFARHPHDIYRSEVGSYIKTVTGKSPSMRYVYATFLSSPNNRWFLSEVLYEMNRTPPFDIFGWCDEMCINLKLCQHEATNDIGYNFFPNGTASIFNDFVYGTVSDELQSVYLDKRCPVRFYLFHGHQCKQPVVMRQWLTAMCQMQITGEYMGNRFTNEVHHVHSQSSADETLQAVIA